MIKKIILGIGIAFVALILGIGALLFWAQRVGSQQQDRIFQAVQSGDANAVLALCDPALRDQVDAPVLTAWMAQVREKLGDYQGLSKSHFSTNAKTDNQGSFVESKGTVHFQKGDATSELVFRDHLLVKFSINSDKIPPGWFTGPADPTLYRERGENFIRKFFARDAKGTASLMHEQLRKVVPDEKLSMMIDNVVGGAGPLKSIEFLDTKFDAGPQKLAVNYRLTCENLPVNATITFEFLGMKGHLMAFNFNDAKRAEEK